MVNVDAFLKNQSSDYQTARKHWDGIKGEILAASGGAKVTSFTQDESDLDRLFFVWLGHTGYLKFLYFPADEFSQSPVRIEYGTANGEAADRRYTPHFSVALTIDGILAGGRHVAAANANAFHRQALCKLADYIRPADVDSWTPSW